MTIRSKCFLEYPLHAHVLTHTQGLTAKKGTLGSSLTGTSLSKPHTLSIWQCIFIYCVLSFQTYHNASKHWPESFSDGETWVKGTQASVDQGAYRTETRCWSLWMKGSQVSATEGDCQTERWQQLRDEKCHITTENPDRFFHKWG